MQIRKYIQGAFRSIPSSIPIRSPSTDTHHGIISPNIPSYLQITQNLTPPKIPLAKKLHNPNYFNEGKKHLDTKIPINQTQHNNVKNEKDQLIKQLTKIINLMKVNLVNPSMDQKLKEEVKVLTLQNQKLLSIIDKLQLSKIRNNNKKYQNIQTQLKEAQDLMNQNKRNHQKQMDTLLKSHKSLAKHCLDLQNQLKKAQNQNQKLMKMLKQKDQSQRKLFISKLQQKNDADFGKQKLSFIKIKQQYNENLNLIKINFQQQIQQILQIEKSVIQNLHQKIQKIDTKLSGLENSKSIKIKKSQIYIEQANQSQKSLNQYQNNRKDYEISQIIQYNRKNNVELSIELQSKKKQLQQIRFKYEKICLDTSTTSYSKRPENYEDRLIKQLKNCQQKDNEIFKLQNEIRQLTEENNFLKSSLKIAQQCQPQGYLNKQQQINLLKQQTQIKLKQLMNIYDQQLQILKAQVNYKNNLIQQMKEQQKLKQAQIQKQISILRAFAINLQQQYSLQKNQLQQKAVQNQILINQLNNKIQNLSKDHNLQQKNKQQEFKLILSQNNQLKNVIQNLKFEYSQKQKREQQNVKQISKLNNLLKIQKQQKEPITVHQNQNKQLKMQIQLILKTINKYKDNNLLDNLIELRNFIQFDKYNDLFKSVNEIQESYNTLSSLLEQKIIQNDNLFKENIKWSSKYLQWEQNRIKLQEKINFLQEKIQIYSKQLQDRKNLYEKIIKQKNFMPKELLSLKFQKIPTNPGQNSAKNFSLCLEKVNQILQNQQRKDEEFKKIIQFQLKSTQKFNYSI